MDRSKTIKKVVLVLIAIGLVVGLLLPTLALGQSKQVACDKIGQFNSRSSDQFTKQRDKLTELRESRLSKLEDQRTARSERIATHRQKFDQSVTEHLERLRKRATNQAQTVAVTEFEKTIKDAMDTRRTAVDAARQKFLEGVKSAVASRRAALDVAAESYRTTVTAAVAKAVADCASGTDPSTVRSELQTSIRDAKEDFREARVNAEKVGPTVSMLTKERRDSVSNAKDEFRKTVEVARNKLKDVLGVRAE